MRSVGETPVAERYLWIDGQVSASSLALVEAGLPSQRPPGSRVYFVGYAYADLPLPVEFTVIFDLQEPARFVEARTRIVAATQQFARPFDELPHGWKTVCLIAFPLGVPDLIDQVPIVDSWGHAGVRLALCGHDTYAMARRGQLTLVR